MSATSRNAVPFTKCHHTCNGRPGTDCESCRRRATPRLARTSPKDRPPVYSIVMGKRMDAEGRVKYQTMSRGRAGLVLGGQQGGRQAWLNGTAHRLNSETARKASRRRWDKHHKVNGHLGIRLGMLFIQPKHPNDRKALRRQYAAVPCKGVTYVPKVGQWTVTLVVGGVTVVRRITERTALRRLGHLQRGTRGAFVPESIKPVYRRGAKFAGTPTLPIQGTVRPYRPQKGNTP